MTRGDPGRLLPDWWPFALLCVPAAFGWLAFRGRGYPFQAAVTGSCLFLVLLAYARSPAVGRSSWLVAAALLLSLAGDWMLSHRRGSGSRFLYGIVLFFLAHAGYVAFSFRNGRPRWLPSCVLFAGFLALYFLRFHRSVFYPAMQAAVLAYIAVSCLSLGAAAGQRGPRSARLLFLLGISLAVFSDTLIGLREFAGVVSWGRLVIPTYHLAQICVTASLMLRGVLERRKRIEGR